MKKVWLLLMAGGLALILVQGAGATPMPEPQWTQWTGGNNHWYEAVYVSGGITWTDAKAAAEARGGYLATATSLEENIFIYGLISDQKFWNVYSTQLGNYYYGPWLGGSDAASEGSWKWVSNEPWSYTNWAGGQPDNSTGNEHYLHFWSNSGFANTWNDKDNAATQINGYIIERNTSPVPLPGAVWLLGSGLLGLAGLRRFRRG